MVIQRYFTHPGENPFDLKAGPVPGWRPPPGKSSTASPIRFAGRANGAAAISPAKKTPIFLKSNLTYLMRHQMGAFNSPCFVPGTPVMLVTGYQVPIEEVEVGDEVITHQGRIQRITETHVREIEEMLVRVRVQKHVRDTLLTTQNHPVLALKAEEIACIRRQHRPCTRNTLRCDDCLYLHEDIARPRWLPAGALEPGDYVVARYAHTELADMDVLDVAKVLGMEVEVVRGQARHIVSQQTRWGQRRKVSTSPGLPNIIPTEPGGHAPVRILSGRG